MNQLYNIMPSISGPCSPLLVISNLSARVNILTASKIAWLELLPSCNMACTHCYSDSSPTRQMNEVKLSEIDWKNIVYEVSRAGYRRIQFIGGEPTIHPSLPKLLRYAAEIGFDSIEVFSNFYRLSDFTLQAMSDSRALALVSVHDVEPEHHDVITGKKGSFDSMLKNVKKAIEKDVRVALVGTLHNRNYAVELEKLASTLGVSSYGLNPVRRAGRGEFLGTESSTGCSGCGQGTICYRYDGQIYKCIFDRTKPVE